MNNTKETIIKIYQLILHETDNNNTLKFQKCCRTRRKIASPVLKQINVNNTQRKDGEMIGLNDHFS